jgi:hypothetical protein
VLLCCCALAGAAAPAAEDGAAKHLLWKVTGPKAVVYLLSTIHAGKADFYPLPSIIEDSFNKADTLIEEIDLSQPAEAARVERGLIEGGSYPNTGRGDWSTPTPIFAAIKPDRDGKTRAPMSRISGGDRRRGD